MMIIYFEITSEITMTEQVLSFQQFFYTGVDAEKFLQGQVTVNVNKLDHHTYQATAICDLKGRIHFGLWLKRHSIEQFEIVICQDLAEELQTHIKKFGAFSKATLTVGDMIYPTVVDHNSSFTCDASQKCEIATWQLNAIQHGQAWITQASSHLFQPQELRLHQRFGVDYDKGCYLGQEIIARLWFKAQPKHWLHLIQGTGDCPQTAEQLNNDVQVVNAISTEQGWLALVTAKPIALESLAVKILELPAPLNADVARPK